MSVLRIFAASRHRWHMRGVLAASTPPHIICPASEFFMVSPTCPSLSPFHTYPLQPTSHFPALANSRPTDTALHWWTSLDQRALSLGKCKPSQRKSETWLDHLGKRGNSRLPSPENPLMLGTTPLHWRQSRHHLATWLMRGDAWSPSSRYKREGYLAAADRCMELIQEVDEQCFVQYEECCLGKRCG